MNDSAACNCLVERVQELGVHSPQQQRANVSVVRRARVRVRGDVVDGVGVVGGLERADPLRHGSRRGGHGGKMHA